MSTSESSDQFAPEELLGVGAGEDILIVDDNEANLTAFQAALEPYKADLLLLDNMNYRFVRDSVSPENTGHACFPGMLTGALFKSPGSGTSNTVAGGPSIDQHIGSSLV